MSEPTIVPVEVHGHTYPIRTTLEPKYVLELAAFVEQRMKLAAESAPGSDVVGLAVLTALNIADEFFRTRASLTSGTGALTAKTEALERMVDQALALAE
jgi:cell division protein ZapA